MVIYTKCLELFRTFCMPLSIAPLQRIWVGTSGRDVIEFLLEANASCDGQTQCVAPFLPNATSSLLASVCSSLLKTEPMMPVETTQLGTPNEH